MAAGADYIRLKSEVQGGSESILDKLMKRMIRWLEAKLFRSKPVNQPSSLESAEPDKTELDLPKDMQDFVNDVPPPGGVENEYGDTLPNLSLDDQFLSDTDEPTGIDPDDTAKLHKK